jgi:uncharacterized protein (TIGR03083 family)
MLPILCAPLLRRVDSRLVDLIEDLRPDEFDLPTVVPRWRVRDICAHLLDTPLRKLSVVRDQHIVEKPGIQGPADLKSFIDRLNEEGVRVYRRLNPQVLVELMRLACHESAAYHESLDPYALAAFPVSWAGESESLNWFDTARELTERWHHQQQIREASGRPGIMTPELYNPVLDCFARALPHSFRHIEAPAGAIVELVITGPCGGRWRIQRLNRAWAFSEATAPPTARAIVPEALAWRIFTRGLPFEAALAQCALEGDQDLAAHILRTVAIV